MGKEKSIDDFAGWEAASEQHDFFGETNLVKDVITTVEKDDIVDDATKEDQAKKDVEEQKLIDEQFKEFEGASKVVVNSEEGNEEDDSDPADTKDTAKIGALSTLNFLKEKGFVEYEEDPEKPITEVEAEALLEDSWDSSVDKAVEETMKSLPQPVKDLILYASKGGDVEDLIANMAAHATSGITKASDIETEAVQIAAVTAKLRKQGVDQEDIDSQIEFLKEKDKLATAGKKAYDEIIADQESAITNQAQEQAKLLDTKKKQARQYKTNITEHINSLKEVEGLPINKEDKNSLPTYISDPSVELKDGRFVSEMQADLFKVMADKDKIVLLAKLLKSDFDFSAIERKKQTQAARGIKDEIQRAERDKTLTTSTTGSSQTKKRSLVEMLGD